MTVLTDTHAWLWWVTDAPQLPSTARKLLDEADMVVVPAICLWEVAMLVQKSRFGLDRPVREFLADAMAWDRVELAPLTPPIAARSSELGAALHGDPADRLIAATALELGLPLVTRDQRLSELQGLRTIW